MIADVTIPPISNRRLLKGFNPDSARTISIVMLVLSALVVVFSRTEEDPDLWGHLRFGLDILTSGSIASVDPYSYLTAGQAWMNHEWLAEVLFALSWTSAGPFGLVLLKLVIAMLTISVVFWRLASIRMKPLRIAILLVLLLIFLAPSFGTVRPQMFTTLLFALTSLIIVRADRCAYRCLWFMPPIFALWVNLHGGVLVGLAVLGCWGAAHLLSHRSSWIKVVLPIVGAVIACCLNPYGVELLLFLLRTATIPRPEIAEWQPLQLISPLGLLYLLLLALSLSSVVFSRLPRSSALLMLFGVVAIMPFVATRHVALYAIAALMLCGDHIGDAWQRWTPLPEQIQRASTWFIGAPITAAIAVFALATADLDRIPVRKPYPVAAIRILKESGISANLAVEFNWGEYVIWHLGPRIRVSVDGRRETVYADDIYQQNLTFLFGVRDWDAVLTRYETDLALISKSFAVYNLLMLNPEWELIYEDFESAMFCKRESTLTEKLRQTAAAFKPLSEERYFP